MKLSNHEKKLLERIQQLGGKANLNDLADVIWPALRPDSWQSALSKKMLMLCAKTQAADIKVVRETPLGRSRKAVYSICQGQTSGGTEK